MQCFVFANRKGGVSKSTSCGALFNWLERFGNGKKSVLIDLDSQCNISFAFGIDTFASDIPTIVDVFTGNASLSDIMHQHSKNGYIVAGSEMLIDYDSGKKDFKVRLESALKSVAKQFDYCIIDAPPSLGRLTVSALLASDKVVIPSQADIYSLQALNSMTKILQSVQQYNKITIAGILLTRHNERLILSKTLTELLDSKAKELGTKVFRSTIREGVAVREASAQQIGLFDYDPHLKSNVAKDYDSFCREFLEVK